MKLIEAMKEIKRLHVKLGDLQAKVALHSADFDFETPAYPQQADQIKEWIQGYSDTLKRILELRIAVQRTNLLTPVTIELGGRQVTKCIAEWVHRRRDLAALEQKVWTSLTDRGLKDGVTKTSSGEMKDVKVRRHYDVRKRDEMVSVFRDEPSLIDATLEVKNAVTDLIDYEPQFAARA